MGQKVMLWFSYITTSLW